MPKTEKVIKRTGFIGRLLDPMTNKVIDKFCTSDGKLNLDNATVQKAIFDLIRPALENRVAELEEEAKENSKKARK